jgi:WD40 repeat protein
MSKRIQLTRTDHELLIDYLDQRLEAAVQIQVEQRLKSDPKLAQALIRLARNEAGLSEWAAFQSQVSARQVVVANRPYHFGPIRRLALAACLALICGAFLYLQFQPEDELNPITTSVAMLEEVQGEAIVVKQDGSSESIRAGQELHAGDQIQTGEESTAVLRLADASKLELNTDTRVELVKRALKSNPGIAIFLATGMVRAEVSAELNPMILQTPHATIEGAGTRFVSLTDDGITRIETESGQLRLTQRSDGRSINVPAGKSVSTNPKRERMATKTLPPKLMEAAQSFSYPEGPILNFAVATRSNRLAIGGWDGTIYLKDLETGRDWPLRDSNRRSRALAFTPDESKFFSSGEDRLLRVRDGMTLDWQSSSKKQRTEIQTMAISPDQEVLVTSAGAIKNVAELKVWHLPGLEDYGILSGHTQAVTQIRFTPDSQWMFTVSRDGELRRWNRATWANTHIVPAHPGGILALAISPDGRQIATGGNDRMIRLWDTENLQPQGILEGHPRAIESLAYSPDGRTLANAGGEPTIRLWNLESGRCKLMLAGHPIKTQILTFASNGKQLISAGLDRTVKIWDLP